MAKHFILTIVALTVVGCLAAPHKEGHEKKGHKDHHGKGMKRLDLSSCMTQAALDNMKKEVEDCKAQIAQMSTTSTAAPASTEATDKKHHRNCGHKKAVFACMFNKSKDMMTSLDTITSYAKANMTTDAQTPFVDTIKACLTEKNVNLADLHKPEAKKEDWKPAMECMREGMHKACKEATPATAAPGESTTASDASIEVEDEDEN